MGKSERRIFGYRIFINLRKEPLLAAQWQSLGALVTVTTNLSSKTLNAFASNDGNHDKRSDRIGPPPAEKCVKDQPKKQNTRQVGAEIRLARVRAQRSTIEARSDSPLGPGQQRHHDQRD